GEGSGPRATQDLDRRARYAGRRCFLWDASAGRDTVLSGDDGGWNAARGLGQLLPLEHLPHLLEPVGGPLVLRPDGDRSDIRFEHLRVRRDGPSLPEVPRVLAMHEGVRGYRAGRGGTLRRPWLARAARRAPYGDRCG